MKKNLLFLVALICSVSLFVGCSDDDNNSNPPAPIQDEFNGVYKGTLDVKVGAPLNTEVKDIPQKIYISKSGENQFKLELKNFSFEEFLIGDIVVTNIAVTPQGDGQCMFTGSSNLTLPVGACQVVVMGMIEGSKTKIEIVVNVATPTEGKSTGPTTGMKVDVDFEGTKMAIDQSSEANILTFTFDSPIVTKQPMINGTDITFVVSESATAEEIAALVPEITISEKATITPASGVAQDFSKSVVYTVTSEDGIVVKKYTVMIDGKSRLFDFNEWETIKTSTNDSKEEYQVPLGAFGTSNPGAMTLNEMGNQVGQNFGYPVFPVKGKVGQAAIIKTLHTAITLPDGSDFNALLGGLLPYVTAGSLYTGKFDLDMGTPLNSTKFGVPFNREPITFKGWYKYSSGSEYRNKKNEVLAGEKDKCSIYAVLYEEKLNENNENIPLTGLDIATSDRVVMKAVAVESSNQVTEWTEFNVSFNALPNKAYDPTKKYYLAIISSSSYKGDAYEGAPGSELAIDEFEIISK